MNLETQFANRISHESNFASLDGLTIDTHTQSIRCFRQHGIANSYQKSHQNLTF